KEINGLEKIIIRDRHGQSFEVYLYGGQVTSFFVTKGQVTFWKNEKGEELLFMSYIQASKSDSWRHSSIVSTITLVRFSLTWICFFLTKSSHGFVRNRFWKIEAHPLPVPSFIYRLRVALGHRGDLTLTSRVRNTDVKPFNFTFALHPYFSVSDIRLYLNTPNKIVVHKEGQIDAVVWNPWEKKVSDLGVEDYSRFVAVESAAVHKPIILEPGKEWKGILQMSVVPSS
ncbi:hypothetical protein HID58_080606, partial [Brassica napus]